MGNYSSYLNLYGNSVGSFSGNTEMKIADFIEEESLVISRSYSDSTLEVMSESKRDKIAAAVGELEINNNKVENAISCIYIKKQMESGFREKIEELNDKLKETEYQVDNLHYLNSRLRHRNVLELENKNNEIKRVKEQLRIMKHQYELLSRKKND
jgi:hypothetical protein